MSSPVHSDSVAVVAISALLGLTLVSVLYNRARRQHGLPPGPTPRLLSGNTYQIPSSEPWKAYANWSQIYGQSSCFFKGWGSALLRNWVIQQAR